MNHINSNHKNSEEIKEELNDGRKMTRALNLDIKEPVDMITAVKSLGGDSKQYFNMLARLEVLYINTCMEQVTIGMNSADWAKM